MFELENNKILCNDEQHHNIFKSKSIQYKTCIINNFINKLFGKQINDILYLPIIINNKIYNVIGFINRTSVCINENYIYIANKFANIYINIILFNNLLQKINETNLIKLDNQENQKNHENIVTDKLNVHEINNLPKTSGCPILRKQRLSSEETEYKIIHDINNYDFDIKLFTEKCNSSLYNSILVPIVISNYDMIIVYVNDLAESLFGYNKSELYKQNVKILMFDNDARHHDSYVQRYKNNKLTSKNPKNRVVGSHPIEIKGKHKLGNELLLYLSLGEMELLDNNYFVAAFQKCNISKPI